ncbi:MAG: nucleotidyl transferase AbiEii/AbiGii toxin family protein, partial [Acidobacteriota bacterium]
MADRRGTVQPYAAEEFPNLFTEPVCSVVALDVERTFWEKATILHEEAHRPPDNVLPPRYSRHYYDLALLAASPVKKRAFGQLDLLSRVIQHKKFFFRRSWSNYDAARPGTFRLLPASERIAELKRDYNKMTVMIFGEPPAFDSLLESLGKLEAEINVTAQFSASEAAGAFGVHH